MIKIKILFLLILSIFFFSCDPEIDTDTPQPGEADFTVYVSLGNSLTAGFADLELYRSGQEHSFSALLARQLKYVGLDTFNQPLMYDDLGFGSRLLIRNVSDCLGIISPTPVRAGGQPFPGNFTWLGNDFPFHNLGVPGAKTGDLLFEGFALQNPYYARFAIDHETSSVLKDAISHQPTFFSLWIGNNDILQYATSGGESGSITPVENFRTSYQILVSEMVAYGAKGALGNIPYIAEVAFFNTIPFNGLVLDDPQQVEQLNAAYGQVAEITFSLGENAFVVSDPVSPAGIRQLQEGELLLLSTPQDSIKCAGWGSTTPIPPRYFLSLEQVSLINNTIIQYNEVIAQYASQYNLALVNLHELLERAKTGISYNGVNFSTEFITGGIFSLDGIHLSKRGNAVVANHYIEAINTTYNSSIPLLNVTDFPGITFP